MVEFENRGTSYVYTHLAQVSNVSRIFYLIYKTHFLSIKKLVLSPSYSKNNATAKNPKSNFPIKR